MTYDITLHGPEAMRAFGERVSTLLQPGDIVTLSGDVGAGKTTLVQGIAWGLGLPRDQYAPSPTYAMALTYPTTPPLHHLDLYRLDDNGSADLLFGDTYFEAHAITLIEWPERAPNWIPERHFALTLSSPEPDVRMVVIHAAHRGLAERAASWWSALAH